MCDLQLLSGQSGGDFGGDGEEGREAGVLFMAGVGASVPGRGGGGGLAVASAPLDVADTTLPHPPQHELLRTLSEQRRRGQLSERQRGRIKGLLLTGNEGSVARAAMTLRDNEEEYRLQEGGTQGQRADGGMRGKRTRGGRKASRKEAKRLQREAREREHVHASRLGYQQLTICYEINKEVG